MIAVTCLASGSSGNSYAVDDGEGALLLEAGVPSRRMLREYAGVLPRVAGCLITHEHMDHAQGAAGLAAAGVDLYATEGTFQSLGKIRQRYRCHAVRAGVQLSAGGWTVMPFEAEHDAAEPVGFLLHSRAAGEKLLFATDTYFLRYRFTGVSVMMVECNHSLPLLERAVEEGRVSGTAKMRLTTSHMSLERLLEFFRAQDLSRVRQIALLHISSRDGCREDFVREVRRATGRPVTAF